MSRQALGLLEDDAEWEVAMTEVSSYGCAHQVRTTFAIILHYCEPTDPFKLFETFMESMADLNASREPLSFVKPNCCGF